MPSAHPSRANSNGKVPSCTRILHASCCGATARTQLPTSTPSHTASGMFPASNPDVTCSTRDPSQHTRAHAWRCQLLMLLLTDADAPTTDRTNKSQRIQHRSARRSTPGKEHARKLCADTRAVGLRTASCSNYVQQTRWEENGGSEQYRLTTAQNRQAGKAKPCTPSHRDRNSTRTQRKAKATPVQHAWRQGGNTTCTWNHATARILIQTAHTASTGAARLNSRCLSHCRLENQGRQVDN